MVYRKGVSAFIINNKKEFLMVCNVKETSNEIDYWKIPAGGVENNESLEEALKREIEEEINLKPTDYKIIAKSKYLDKFEWPKEVLENKFKKKGIWYDGQERVIYLLKLINNKPKFKLQKKEVSSIKWFNKNNFKEYLYIERQKILMGKIIEEFKEYF